jgi:hypothetical protein
MNDYKFRYVWKRSNSYACGGYQPTDPKIMFSFITLVDMDKRAKSEYDYEYKSIFPSITKDMSPRLKLITSGYTILVARNIFIGIKDKNGKEIYEGDIMVYPEESKPRNLFEVMFDGGCFVANCKNRSYFKYIREFIIDPVEIIGNIYENPELLQQGNNH